MPQGSSFPSAVDNFRIFNEGTTPFDVNVANEIAAAIEALELILGLNLHNFTEIGYAAAQADFNTALKNRARYEAGTFTHAGSTIATAVLFANPARFTATPIVILNQRQAQIPDNRENFWTTAESTAGFTSLRRQGSNPNSGTAWAMQYFAFQIPT